MRLGLASAAVLAWLGVGATAAQATGILLGPNSRNVVRAEASLWTSAGLLTESVSDDRRDDEFTPYDESVQAEEAIVGTEAFAQTSLWSELSSTRIVVRGRTDASVDASDPYGSRAVADLYFSLEFQVEEQTGFRLDLLLEGVGSDVYMDARLRGYRDVQEEYELRAPGAERHVVQGVFKPGVEYSLRISATSFSVTGDHPFVRSERTDQSFDLTLMLPEPPAIGLLAAALGAALAVRRRS